MKSANPRLALSLFDVVPGSSARTYNAVAAGTAAFETFFTIPGAVDDAFASRTMTDVNIASLGFLGLDKLRAPKRFTH
ncbi:MAG TPA: hypothetical protein VE967_04835 [Gemmatimonadaceae bacterium]|nr:hypothetical protein [Gemmatimonadaceae bacterium]